MPHRSCAHRHASSTLPLAAATLCAVLAPILPLFAQTADATRFDVASIKPNREEAGHVAISWRGSQYSAIGVTVPLLIRLAYQVQEDQIAGGPPWLATEHFDVLATAANGADNSRPASPGQPSRQQLMLRALLAERFGLKVHTESRTRDTYALVVARRDGRLGPALRRVTVDCAARATAAGGRGAAPPPPGDPGSCGTSMAPGRFMARGQTMAQIAASLATLSNTGMSLYRPIIDRTGLTGTFDATLQFTPDTIPVQDANAPAIDRNGPSIFSAVQEQLGLKLEPRKAAIDVLVIDDVQRPTAN
jgi:uncharacterized protein (TIGR03435 family)